MNSEEYLHGGNGHLLILFYCSFIDQGKNPDLYIKTYLENCLKANEQTKGKIEAIQVHSPHPPPFIT